MVLMRSITSGVATGLPPARLIRPSHSAPGQIVHERMPVRGAGGVSEKVRANPCTRPTSGYSRMRAAERASEPGVSRSSAESRTTNSPSTPDTASLNVAM
jgi:hypothetical protein